MTAIGVSKRNAMHDWKRRGERLVRASGRPYTIVRPGWFDYNDATEMQVEMLQGDRRLAGSPADGVIARSQIAEVLVASLGAPEARLKTFELVAERGPAVGDLKPLFSQLRPDLPGTYDAILDRNNMPLDQEPDSVMKDLVMVKVQPPS